MMANVATDGAVSGFSSLSGITSRQVVRTFAARDGRP